MLRVAVAAQAAEALGLCVVIVLNVIDSASGNTWTASNAIAQIVFEAVVAAGVAWIALGIARARPWSRTPALLTQVFTGMIAIWLLEAHRYAWGVPALLLAIAGLAGLVAPSSWKALARRSEPAELDRFWDQGGQIIPGQAHADTSERGKFSRLLARPSRRR
jgi:hypothetical protein